MKQGYTASTYKFVVDVHLSSSPANVMAPPFLPARLRIGCPVKRAIPLSPSSPVLPARAAGELLRLLRQQPVLERERLFPRTVPRPAANLSVVSIEVRPPSGSPFALKEVQVDLRRSVLNDFSWPLRWPQRAA